jgi:hypothetical protein
MDASKFAPTGSNKALISAGTGLKNKYRDITMSLTQTQVSELYVAIFGRPSEKEGSEYWSSVDTENKYLARNMIYDSSAQAYFGDSFDDDQAFIEHIYLNTFGRTLEDDPTGIAFWVDALKANYPGGRGFVVTEMIAALKRDEPADSHALNQFLNRVEVSNYYAERIDIGLEESYFGESGLNVTSDVASIDTAKAKIDELLAELDPDAPTVVFSLENHLEEAVILEAPNSLSIDEVQPIMVRPEKSRQFLW